MSRTTAISLILVALLSGVPDVGYASLDLLQGCWKTKTPNDGTTNTVSFCVEGDSVDATIFYPNRGSNSTTCNAKGSVELIGPTKLTIRTQPGSCENGRGLGAASLDCTVLNHSEMNCLHPNFEQIHLWRVDVPDNNAPISSDVR